MKEIEALPERDLGIFPLRISTRNIMSYSYSKLLSSTLVALSLLFSTHALSQTILEAEDAYFSSGSIDNNHTGYTGTGFVNTDNITGEFIEWFFHVASPVTDTLEFRYALGSPAARPMEVYVNQVLTDTLDFVFSGAFSNYVYDSTSAQLVAGVNRVKLVAINPEGAPNMDHLRIKSDTLPLPYYSLLVTSGNGGTASTTAVGDSALAGSRITLTAVPDPGYSFAGWTGDINTQTQPLSLLMDQNYVIEANFLNSLPAFPGADGYGKNTTGGRGGVVIEVTNLNDLGPGSLRAAVNTPGARTIVFRVSGTIFLNSSLTINRGDLTIAGQTAPGDGICLANYPIVVRANNVIIRYLRARLGDQANQENDALSANDVQNLIVDHCTFSWGIDEVASLYQNVNTTMQWCIISESLYRSVHSKGDHGYGGIWGGNNSSFHHNLLAHHSSRNPRFNGARYEANWDERVDFRNNVIYNWGFNSSYGGDPSEIDGNKAQINMVNNYYKYGPATNNNAVRFRVLQPSSNAFGHSLWHVEGNFLYGFPLATDDNWTYAVQGVSAAVKDQIRVIEPFEFEMDSTQSPEVAFEYVLANSGAVLPNRDSVDKRVIMETCTGTATYGGAFSSLPRGIIDSQTDVGGWPTLASTTPPLDSDHDGMPDDWELNRGLDPNDADDRNDDDDSDGYTNLEEYLNSLVERFEYAVRPIELEATGLPNGEVELTWTDIGIFDSEFLIEREKDGAGFTSLATVSGNATSYLDTGLDNGQYDYRIRTVTSMDSSCFTEPVSVSITSNLDRAETLFQRLEVYPNPFVDGIHIELEIGEATDVAISIYNGQGQRLDELSQQRLLPGTQLLRWDAPSTLPAGLYVVQISTSRGVVSRNLIKR